MSEFPYRLTTRNAATALAATVRADPDFVAGCLVIGGAHGFSMELEYMQRTDGTTRYRVWSDVQGAISTEERGPLLDFAAELAALRAAGTIDQRLPKGSGKSRFALVVLADRESGVWLEAQTPVKGESRVEGPLARIFSLVFPS